MGQLLAILSCDSTSLNLITWHALSLGRQEPCEWQKSGAHSTALLSWSTSQSITSSTEWKCVCQGGGDSLCISKTAKGFYAKCKLQPESYRSTKLLRTSDWGLSKQISLRELAYTVTFQSIFKVLLAPDRRWELQFHLLIMRGFGGWGDL